MSLYFKFSVRYSWNTLKTQYHYPDLIDFQYAPLTYTLWEFTVLIYILWVVGNLKKIFFSLIVCTSCNLFQLKTVRIKLSRLEFYNPLRDFKITKSSTELGQLIIQIVFFWIHYKLVIMNLIRFNILKIFINTTMNYS